MRSVSRGAVPALTTEQMRAVDRAMVDDLHIDLVQMMENAGRNLAEPASAGPPPPRTPPGRPPRRAACPRSSG